MLTLIGWQGGSEQVRGAWSCALSGGGAERRNASRHRPQMNALQSKRRRAFAVSTQAAPSAAGLVDSSELDQIGPNWTKNANDVRTSSLLPRGGDGSSPQWPSRHDELETSRPGPVFRAGVAASGGVRARCAAMLSLSKGCGVS